MEEEKQPSVGDEAWFVEWYAEMARDSNGDIDFDRSVMAIRQVVSEADAERLAREVYPKARMAVAIWPARYASYDTVDATRYPHLGCWVATADVRYYEGEGEGKGKGED